MANYSTDFRHDFTTDCEAYRTALDCAQKRALHSYFDQHIITDREARYLAIDEGDYDALAPNLASRVVETVRGHLSDEH